MNENDTSQIENEESSNENNSPDSLLSKNEESSNENDSPDSLVLEDNEYSFGWNKYSETTNGRFAMIGFLAILIIELFSKQSFLNWCGLFN